MRVHNCAVAAYASSHVTRAAYVLLEHFNPDLLVVYSGNNEFIDWYYPIVRRLGRIDLSALSHRLTVSYVYRGLIFLHRIWCSDFPVE